MSERLRIALLLVAALTITGCLVAGALAAAIVRSLGYGSATGVAGPGLDAYRAVLSDPGFLRSLLLSLHISVTSTALATAIAIAVAMLLRETFAGRRMVLFLFQFGLTVPHIVFAIGILYLFGQSGFVARLAYQAGAVGGPADFPALIFDPFATGIILHYVWKEVPFIGLVVLAQMHTLGADYENVARSLGATRWQAFRHVLLPLILPGVLAASVIVFAFTFGAYEVPLLLGASQPQALPVTAYRAFTDVELASRPEAMAMSVLIVALGGVLLWAYMRLGRGWPVR
jgi:putative spermidine/putrescine transport system permease protein